MAGRNGAKMEGPTLRYGTGCPSPETEGQLCRDTGAPDLSVKLKRNTDSPAPQSVGLKFYRNLTVPSGNVPEASRPTLRPGGCSHGMSGRSSHNPSPCF